MGPRWVGSALGGKSGIFFPKQDSAEPEYSGIQVVTYLTVFDQCRIFS